MRVDRTFNTDEIEKILYHSDVIRLSTEDGAKGDVNPEAACFVGTYVDDEIVGVFVFQPINKVSLDTHCYFLPEHRRKVSTESFRLSVDWVLSNSPYKKLIVKCNQRDWHVKNFCLKNGFVLEGRLKDSAISKGAIVDEYMLGMTKDQFSEYVSNV